MSLSANAPSIDDRYRLVVRKRLMLALLIIAAIVASLVLTLRLARLICRSASSGKRCCTRQALMRGRALSSGISVYPMR